MASDLTSMERIMAIAGLTTPTMRFLAVTVGVTGIVLAVKPDFAFDRLGNPRKWNLIWQDEQATAVPWFAPGLVLGAVAGLFL